VKFRCRRRSHHFAAIKARQAIRAALRTRRLKRSPSNKTGRSSTPLLSATTIPSKERIVIMAGSFAPNPAALHYN
jgi:hypothetical protein